MRSLIGRAEFGQPERPARRRRRDCTWRLVTFHCPSRCRYGGQGATVGSLVESASLACASLALRQRTAPGSASSTRIFHQAIPCSSRSALTLAARSVSTGPRVRLALSGRARALSTGAFHGLGLAGTRALGRGLLLRLLGGQVGVLDSLGLVPLVVGLRLLGLRCGPSDSHFDRVGVGVPGWPGPKPMSVGTALRAWPRHGA